MLTKQLESLQTYISTAVKTEEQQHTQQLQAPPPAQYPQFSQPPMYAGQIPQPMMGVAPIVQQTMSLGGFQPQTIQGQQAMQTQQFMGQQFGHQ